MNVGSIHVRGSVTNIEFGPAGHVMATAAPVVGTGLTNASFHMNEYLHLQERYVADESSEHRLARARAIAKVHNIRPNSYESFYGILGDQSDSAFPLYRDASGADNAATAATVLFVLASETGSPRMIVSENGNPLASSTRVVSFPIDLR